MVLGILGAESPFMRMHKRSWIFGAVALTGALATMLTVSAAGLQRATRSIFVSVTDKAGQPVTDLALTDISVREDNQEREVLAVSKATAPMRIAFLIDNSQITREATNEIRLAGTAFVTALLKASPDSTISVATFGDRPTPVESFTSSLPVLLRAVQKTFPMPGSGAYLTDAIIDASKSLRKDAQPRQLIVALVDETGEEFSNSSRQQATQALRESGAALWVVSLQGPGGANIDSTEARDRASVIGDATTQSGGQAITVLNRNGLADKLTELARTVTSQIAVTYGRPDQLIPPSKIEVQTTRKDIKVRGPRWTGK